jgi:hypothetical protein
MLLFSQQKNAFTNLSNLLLLYYLLKFWHSISGMDCKLETELCHYATFKKCFLVQWVHLTLTNTAFADVMKSN